MTDHVSTASRTGPHRLDATVAGGALGLLLLGAGLLSATGTTGEFLAWAWARHANILSWYVRPLFLIPLAYFAYRRRSSGIVITLLALATSMFWFPRPAQVTPAVTEFLAFERAWLTSGWDLQKLLMTLLPVIGLSALCAAFWRRSLTWGLVVINVLAVTKLAWGVLFGQGTGWAMLAPATTGLLVCDAAVLYAIRRVRRRSTRRPARPTSAPTGPAV